MKKIPDPINRPDGRHWCNPASAPLDGGDVKCPDCGKVWGNDGGNVWSEKQAE